MQGVAATSEWTGHPVVAPGGLWLFGEKGYFTLIMDDTQPEQIEIAKKAFPEARITTDREFFRWDK